MKKKSTNYSSSNSGGWMNMCDSLFLARFRGRPCEICGKTNSFYAGRVTRSMGHHILSKEIHRLYRYDEDNIIILCPDHHLGHTCSPHSHDGVEVARFYEWLRENRPEKSELMHKNRSEKFNMNWNYREMYEILGGETHSKTGLIKDLRPYKHSAKVAEIENK